MFSVLLLSLLSASTVNGLSNCWCRRRVSDEQIAATNEQICKAAHDAALQSVSVQELYENSGQGNADTIFDYVMGVAAYCDQEYHTLSEDPDADELMLAEYKQCRGYATASGLLVKHLGHQTAGTSDFLISLAGNIDDQNHSCGTLVNEVNHAMELGVFECLEVYDDADGRQWARVSDSEECQAEFATLEGMEDILTDLDDTFVTGELDAPVPMDLGSASVATAVVAGSSALGTAVTVLMAICRSYVGQI